MLEDVLHNQCVQDMDVDHHIVQVVEDQVMVVVDVDQVMVVVDVAEMDLQEINTKKEEVHVHHTDDKAAIVEKNGSLTLKDKD